MSNSPLVSFTQISPNKSSPRNHKIDTITIHCYVGQVDVKRMGRGFANPINETSCNYGIGSDGKIGMYVEEKDRSWCSSNKANDHRAITIECASDSKPPYAINDKVYASLIDLLTDICKRNGIPKLLWVDDKSLIGKVDKQNMTVHRWFAKKSCPGDYIFHRLGQIADEVNERLAAEKKPDVSTSPSTSATPAPEPSTFKVRVSATDLRIRSGPGTNYSTQRTFIKPGVYTIVEKKPGVGSKSGWGRLKSGAGWISLDFVKMGV